MEAYKTEPFDHVVNSFGVKERLINNRYICNIMHLPSMCLELRWDKVESRPKRKTTYGSFWKTHALN